MPGTVQAVIAATAFDELGIGVSIQWAGTWRAINVEPSVNAFEIERGNTLLRYAYNERCLARARAERRPVHGQHAGFHDLFVPVPGSDRVLVAGPFAVRYPSATDVTERWYAITHARAHLADPAFSRYLAATLDTLTLEGPLLRAFDRLLSCFASLLGGTGDPEALAREADALKNRLLQARAAERMWEEARSMVDDRTAHTWSTQLMRDPLIRLGMRSPPQHAVVGLLRSRRDVSDPIDEALRRRACQRSVASFAWRRGNVACGVVGNQGVALMVTTSATGARVRRVLEDVARSVSDVARRLGFGVHAGIAAAEPSQSLPSCYRAALGAADRALSRGVSAVSSKGRTERTVSLGELRAGLAESAEAEPGVVVPRFERYAEVVLVRTGGQLDATRAHLEAGLERLAEPLLASGRLDRKSFDELCVPVETALDGPGTVTALVSAYRRVVAGIERAMQSPTRAHRARSAQRALAFVREHLSEPLTLTEVARVAGYAPDYFSRLVKRAEGSTFEQYLQTLRLDRAKQLFTSTSLSVEQIARRVGYASRTYFQRMFRVRTGRTPIEYRRRTNK
jgi:AraC-like DNA-binding protein